jgi:hypothetical protein
MRNMPRGDGTGPLRLMLRGGGRSLMKIARMSGKRSMGRGLLGLGVPVIAAIIHDMKQPDGYLRPVINKFISRRPTIKVIDAQQRPGDAHNKIEKK